ncbi:MAG: hypothetical protein ACREFM_21045, partial [Hypericibacter sp.]
IDVIVGGAGDDTIIGGNGADALFGSEGNDVFMMQVGEWAHGYEAPETAEVIIGADENDQLFFDDIQLTGGTRDAYYVYIDEFENESWVPSDFMLWGNPDDPIAYFLNEDGLWVDYYGPEETEYILVPDWENGDLGLTMTDVDNRYPLGEGMLMAPGGDTESSATMKDTSHLSVSDLFEGHGVQIGAEVVSNVASTAADYLSAVQEITQAAQSLILEQS